MNWVSDEEIQSFFDSATLRVEVTQVYRIDVSEAWVVLSADSRTYLGTVTRTGNNWNAFSALDSKGTRVTSFTSALQLIELTCGSNKWIEELSTHRRYPKPDVTRPVEEES